MAKRETENAKAISNEEVVAALLSNTTIAAAADAVGLSLRAMYDRMATSDFKQLYAAARAGIVRQALITVNSKLSRAVEVVAEIMEDKTTNPAVRLQCCQTLINAVAKLGERLQSEDAAAQENEKSPFDFDY